MSRSISEVDLFKSDEDKKKYMLIVKEYQKLYNFKVNAYCLMDNHLHLMIDVNGADISRIMHGINFKYAQYFNMKYKRHGHLFQDRFKSKIVKNERYLFALSVYIHNNPKDIEGYENSPEKYYFSSLAVYLGLKKDPFQLVDEKYILSLMGDNLKDARKKYQYLTLQSSDIIKNGEGEFEGEGTEYRSGRKILVRNFKIEDVIEFIANKMEVDAIKIHIKNCRETVHTKALLVVFLRSLCNIKCRTICSILGNITQSRVSELSAIGIKIIDEDERHKQLYKDFISCYS